MNTRHLLVIAVAAGLAGCTGADAPLPTAPAASGPSLSNKAPPIDDTYIVVFEPGADAAALARELGIKHRGKLKHLYKSALKGGAFEMSAADAAAVGDDPRVALVEQDQPVSLIAAQTPVPSWGLDRIDQAALPLDNSYTYDTDAAGVRVYIIDTGINFGHVDYAGRALTGFDAITPGGTAADCHGHGSHVAGTAGGTSFGVAKAVTLVAVRVLGCGGSGATSGVIAGVDWVTNDHLTSGGSGVANMSLGGGFSAAMNLAVANSVAAGVTYAIAAGNSGADACSFSPASEPSAITVAASSISDVFASFSNWGTCVDIIAPGVSITSAWIGSPTATNTISGTSMASPHVAGAAALEVALNPGSSPAVVANALLGRAVAGAILGPPLGTPNRLLQTRGTAPPPPPPPPPPPTPPVASFTYACSGLTCTFTNTSTNASASSWNFGDGTPLSTVTNPTHTFRAARGKYSVSLTVTNAAGTSTATKLVSCTRKACS